MKYGKIALLVAVCTALTTVLSPVAALAEYDAPYLSLGADLTADEETEVLKLLGVSRDKVNEDSTVYVTNEEERRYLAGVPGGNQAENEALSACRVVRHRRGYGLKVKTCNIESFSEEIFANAFATCGMYDADVVIVSPENLCGTEALVGAVAAWSKMIGLALDADVIGLAARELLASRQIVSSGCDEEKTAELVAVLKYVVLYNRMDEEDEIREAIRDVAGQLGLSVSESDRNRLIGVLKGIGEQGIDISAVEDRALDICRSLGESTPDLSGYGIRM